jgi:hypothetical protein
MTLANIVIAKRASRRLNGGMRRVLPSGSRPPPSPGEESNPVPGKGSRENKEWVAAPYVFLSYQIKPSR